MDGQGDIDQITVVVEEDLLHRLDRGGLCRRILRLDLRAKC
jgi:hypothetical protein